MSGRAVGLAFALGLALGLAAAAQESPETPQPLEAEVHTVDTALRSLGDCPRKHVITSAEDYAKVVSGLEGAPPAPDFASRHVALLIFDRGAFGATEVGEPTLVEGALRVPIVLRQGEGAEGQRSLRCVFVVVPSFTGGVLLAQRRELGEGRGHVE